MKRRDFIKGCSAGLALMATPGLSIFSQTSKESDAHCFVVLFLRGGCDGLQLIAPASDAIYQDARPQELKVGESGKNKGFALNNGLGDIGFFLHPSAPELHEFYQQGELAVLHSCGLANGTRSHFKAMALIERGVAGSHSAQEGWMTRLLHSLQPDTALPGVASSKGLPLSFSGYDPAVNIPSIKEFVLPQNHDFPHLLKKWYGNNSRMDTTAQMTLQALEKVANMKTTRGNPQSYPKEWYSEKFGQDLSCMASLIRSDLGVRLAVIDHVGWDTHETQAKYFPNQVRALSQGLAAFYQDLGDQQKNVTVLVMSEFGRRLRANLSNGTDHGYGNIMMVLGKDVKGGQMFGKWPGLKSELLDRGVDLDITTDYRSVLSEILMTKMGLSDPSVVFPEFQAPAKLGLFG